MAGGWTDLLDPDRTALESAAPVRLLPRVLELLAAPAADQAQPRPTLESHDDYVFGLFLVAVAVPAEDRVFYQEVGFVLGRDWIVTVRKTPPGEAPFDPAPVREICRQAGRDRPPWVAYYLVDEVAERYFDLAGNLEDEIDELEDRIQDWRAQRVDARLSELRHDLLHIRRTVTPTRDAARRVVDGRVDLKGDELFDRELELAFADAYDKLVRANESLELARELLGASRDHLQARIGQEQNDVIRKLAVIASLLLVPTFIVGVYGQNFEHMPELGWSLGYLFSWSVIVLATILQLVLFRWRRWI